VGFQLQWSGFYPDFIVWVKSGKKQIMVFIDPHGLEHEKCGLENEKIKFAGFVEKGDTETIHIKHIQEELNKKYKRNIVLESFILSPTSHDKLIKGITSPPSKDKYINRHVLFLKDEDWPKKLFSGLIIATDQRF